jgi:hypothetical protein
MNDGDGSVSDMTDGAVSPSPSTANTKNIVFTSPTKTDQGYIKSRHNTETGREESSLNETNSIFSASERRQLETMLSQNDGQIGTVAMRGISSLLGNVRQRRASMALGGSGITATPTATEHLAETTAVSAFSNIQITEPAKDTEQTSPTDAEPQSQTIIPFSGDDSGTNQSVNEESIIVTMNESASVDVGAGVGVGVGADADGGADTGADAEDDFTLALKAQAELLKSTANLTATNTSDK